MSTKPLNIPSRTSRNWRLIPVLACLLGLAPARTAWAQVIHVPYWFNIGPKVINEYRITTITNVLDEVITTETLIEQDTGRVAAVAVDPSNSSHWLVGSAHGGIWETADSGANWYPRGDGQASMATGAIAFAPSNPLLVYVGTGEQNFRGDAYAGAGLLVSHDGGTDWTMLNTNFAKTSFSHIWVDPSDTNNLVVSTVRGGAASGRNPRGWATCRARRRAGCLFRRTVEVILRKC